MNIRMHSFVALTIDHFSGKLICEQLINVYLTCLLTHLSLAYSLAACMFTSCMYTHSLLVLTQRAPAALNASLESLKQS